MLSCQQDACHKLSRSCVSRGGNLDDLDHGHVPVQWRCVETFLYLLLEDEMQMHDATG